ncbi:hypothetical protein Vafri_4654, partial [Volvox africanus]
MAARSPLRGAKQDKASVRATVETWLFIAVAAVFGVLFIYVAIARSTSPTHMQPTGQIHLHPYKPQARRALRNFAPTGTFGTIYHGELSSQFSALTDTPRLDDLIATLKQMEGAGIGTVIFSTTWEWAEPKEGNIRYRYLDMLMDAACRNTSLKVNFAVDLVTAPTWVWERYPDAISCDSDGRKYVRLSWFHSLGNAAAREFLTHVATHLANGYQGCIVAVQPVYNNAYQTRFTQEYDAFQDYSPYALVEYRNWLQRKGMPLELFNVRWGTSFRRWGDVEPPKLHSGDFLGVDFSARYWDWLRFREESGSQVYITACLAVAATGLQCFHRFSEFFSVVDAIYGAPMFKHIASSPATSFLVMDSNFITPYGTHIKPSKLRLYIAAARSYGKPVHFEAAVERVANYSLIGEAFRSALMAGAESVGISHWLTRISPNDSLVKAYNTVPKCMATELVGVFIPLDSCSAFHGLQWGWARTDPLHGFIE